MALPVQKHKKSTILRRNAQDALVSRSYFQEKDPVIKRSDPFALCAEISNEIIPGSF
jgi:hypothetical protein